MAKRAVIPLATPPQYYSSEAKYATVVQRSWFGNNIIRSPLYIHSVEMARRRTSHWYRTDYFNHFLIIYLPDGKLRYKYAGNSCIVSGRRVLLIPPGKAFSFETVSGEEYCKHVMFLNGVNLPGITETLGLNQVTLLELDNTDALREYFRRTYTILSKQDDRDLPLLSGISMELLNYLAGFLPETNVVPLIFEVIKNHIANDFSPEFELGKLALEFKISIRTINRLFRTHMDMTPLQYRRSCRFKASCELLGTTELSIKEIADHLGYCNQFHFSREFANQSGMPPGAWRTKHRAGK